MTSDNTGKWRVILAMNWSPKITIVSKVLNLLMCHMIQTNYKVMKLCYHKPWINDDLKHLTKKHAFIFKKMYIHAIEFKGRLTCNVHNKTARVDIPIEVGGCVCNGLTALLQNQGRVGISWRDYKWLNSSIICKGWPIVADESIFVESHISRTVRNGRSSGIYKEKNEIRNQLK